MKRWPRLLALLILLPGAAAAETVYVTDQLRLSLYDAPGDQSEVIRFLTSGEALEALGEDGPYMRVRTSKGEEGWAKRAFLVKEKTAALLLADARRQLASAEGELERARASESGRGDALKDLKTQVETLNADLKVALEERDASRERVVELERMLSPPDPNATLARAAVAIIGLAAALTIGFLIGKQLVERRLRRRFSGVKVW